MNKKTTPTPKTILYSSKLTPAEILIYIYLIKVIHFYYITRKSYKINVSEISTKLNLSRPTTRKSINKLIELNLLDVNTNTLYYFNKYDRLENWEDFNNEAFKYSELIKDSFNGYVEMTDDLLFNQELLAGEKITLLKIKSVKLEKLHFNSICKITNIKRDNFNKLLSKLKEKGYIKYNLKRIGSNIEDTQIANLQIFDKPIQNEIKNESVNETKKEVKIITKNETKIQTKNELENLSTKKEETIQNEITNETTNEITNEITNETKEEIQINSKWEEMKKQIQKEKEETRKKIFNNDLFENNVQEENTTISEDENLKNIFNEIEKENVQNEITNENTISVFFDDVFNNKLDEEKETIQEENKLSNVYDIDNMIINFLNCSAS